MEMVGLGSAIDQDALGSCCLAPCPWTWRLGTEAILRHERYLKFSTIPFLFLREDSLDILFRVLFITSISEDVILSFL